VLHYRSSKTTSSGAAAVCVCCSKSQQLLCTVLSVVSRRKHDAAQLMFLAMVAHSPDEPGISAVLSAGVEVASDTEQQHTEV
jgi:hypothetical protein